MCGFVSFGFGIHQIFRLQTEKSSVKCSERAVVSLPILSASNCRPRVAIGVGIKQSLDLLRSHSIALGIGNIFLRGNTMKYCYLDIKACFFEL